MPRFKEDCVDPDLCISGFLNQRLLRAIKLANIRDEPNPDRKSS